MPLNISKKTWISSYNYLQVLDFTSKTFLAEPNSTTGILYNISNAYTTLFLFLFSIFSVLF